MNPIELLVLLVIAGIAGSLGQTLAGRSRFGWIGTIVLGFVGAYLGIYLARQFSLPAILPVRIGGTMFPLVWSIVGSALLVYVIGLFTRR